VLVQTTALHLELARIPYVARTDTGLLVSRAVVTRHAALVAALEGTAGLQDAWVRLTTGSVAATRLGSLLAQHDEQVTDAAALGRAAATRTRWRDSRGGRDARRGPTLRNQLANTVDVTVLDEWLDRNAAYDVALRGLYTAYAKVGSRVTDELRDAIAAERAARRDLPPTRAA
jgi:hypothetical protein